CDDTATPEIYTLSLHDALPISGGEFLVYKSTRPAHPQHAGATARLRPGPQVSAAGAHAWRAVFAMAGCLGAALELPSAVGEWLCAAADQLRRLDQSGRGIRPGDPGRSAERPGR